jgi:hypothetical protein
MATVLSCIAWSIDFLLNVLTAVTAGCFFLISPTFRRQSYRRWTRRRPATPEMTASRISRTA